MGRIKPQNVLLHKAKILSLVKMLQKLVHTRHGGRNHPLEKSRFDPCQMFDQISTRYLLPSLSSKLLQAMQVAGRGRTKVLVPKDANIPPDKMQV